MQISVSTEVLEVALRVLTAITGHQKPNEDDLDTLRKYAPFLAHEPADELACDVVQQALQQRAEVRSAGR